MNFGQHLKIFLTTQKILSEYQAKSNLHRYTYYLFAVMFLFFAIILLNVGIYFYLIPIFGLARSAMILSPGNILVAFALYYFATRRKESDEIQALKKIRNQSLTELEASVSEIKADFDFVRGDITKLQQNIHQFSQDPIGTLMPMSAFSSAINLIRMAKSKKTKGKEIEKS